MYIGIPYTYFENLQWQELMKLHQNSKSACRDRHENHLITHRNGWGVAQNVRDTETIILLVIVEYALRMTDV